MMLFDDPHALNLDVCASWVEYLMEVQGVEAQNCSFGRTTRARYESDFTAENGGCGWEMAAAAAGGKAATVVRSGTAAEIGRR